MKVVITGGTGFLGRGILRRFYGTHELVVLSRDEYKQDLCKQKYPKVQYVLGDVTDYERLLRTFEGADLVIHTAAIKYIPEAEMNVDECIDVNVAGSNGVLEAAYAQRVKSVIGVSTDKACSPLNVYGATKLLMERLFGEYSRTTGLHCALARYGNVIGSTGSVIPIFKRQLEWFGTVNITNPDMTRYWITVDEAVDLIELAQVASSGSIIIPKPRAMRLRDLALALINDYEATHSNEERLGEKRINVIGTRPGEKMHESLLNEAESVRAHDYANHYELLPVGQAAISGPFSLSSNIPQGGWISSTELLTAIVDAEKV